MKHRRDRMPKKSTSTTTTAVNTNTGLTTDGIQVALLRRTNGTYEVVPPSPSTLRGKTATLVEVTISGKLVKRWELS